MTELIQINNDGEKSTVNARDLHNFLESKQEFSNWIKGRISQYDFIEDQDFITNDKIINRSKMKDYHISIDMAKELSMVERNEKGKQARRYFIECEKRALNPISQLSRIEILRMAVEAEEKVLLLESNLESAKEEITNLKPMAEYGHKVFTSENTYTATNIGCHIGWSPIKLNKYLRDKKVIKLGSGSSDYELCSKFLKHDLATHIKRPVTHTDGSIEVKLQLRWTRKGFDWLVGQLTKPVDKLTESTIK